MSEEKRPNTEITYELQYLSHEGKWNTGSCYNMKSKAIETYEAMKQRFPRQKYRLIRKTVKIDVL